MSSLGRAMALSILISALPAACATTELRCTAGEEPMVSDVLYFGMARVNGAVTAEEWSQFLRAAITPRFPAGLTSWQASGQWKSADGSIVREPSYVVQLIHPDSEQNEAAVRAIMFEYKSSFEQEAVMRVRGRSCISF